VSVQRTRLSRLYPIIDVSCFSASQRTSGEIFQYARELAAGGATLIQYRNKHGNPRDIVSDARELRRVLGDNVTLIMNDRADLCVAAECDGVHVGQDDLSPEGARAVVGAGCLLGVSTHNLEQLDQAANGPADYVAIGPVFSTVSKQNPDPVVGLEGVRAARAATTKPLVAIGGISFSNARSVIEAGADSVAIISALIATPRDSVRKLLELLEQL
jgi:thiamine-phosphate pyrophosphorylase